MPFLKVFFSAEIQGGGLSTRFQFTNSMVVYPLNKIKIKKDLKILVKTNIGTLLISGL